MNRWRFKRSLIAASVICVLGGSTAQAQQPAPGELEALKKMMQEVLSQNEDLRRRVRELEEAVKRKGKGKLEELFASEDSWVVK